MKEPTKPKATTKAAMQTDSEALSDIVAWSSDRPAWQRQALRLLVQHPVLPAEQLEALYQLAFDAGNAAAPLAETDVRSPKSSAVVVTLKSVTNPHDVNALASDQSLSFEKSGLTIVYGDNGAGKSGYARILKLACRARLDGKGSSILPNIYEQAAGVPRAQIAYVTNGQSRQVDWRSDATSPPELSAISVFDSRTATVHVDGTNEVAYTPYALELMQRLAQTADRLREKCKLEQAAIEAQTPDALRAPPIDSETSVARALASLTGESVASAFEALAALTPEETAQLVALRQDLSSDPVRAAKQMNESSAALLRLMEIVRQLCAHASPGSLSGLRALLADKEATRQAADVAAKASFSGEPIPEVGSATWRALWDAARRFAAAAIPGQAFPPQSEEAHCPLCQQPLSDDALGRFRRFDEFVKDDTRTRADSAEKAYQDQISLMKSHLMPASQLLARVRFIGSNLGDESVQESLRVVAVKATWQLRLILRSHARADLAVDELDPSGALSALQKLSDQLKQRASAVSADAQSPERKALVAQFNELEAKSWLGTMLPDVGRQIERKKRLETLDRVSKETETRAITQKASQLAEALVTDALRAQFNKEIAALGVSDLAVELKKESSQSGAARFRVRLVRKPNAAVGAVLSEGEHRCVALAAFLAELATSGSKSAIIFDDPVSSLDHRHREQVAARLVAEARHRQVIVLTHDVAFLMLLDKAAQEQQVHVGYRCVARGSDLAGYCSNEIPFNARPVESVLDAIEADIKNKKILHEKGRQAEWRNAVRGALEQLRETWERAVEEFIGPVFKRLSTKVESRNLRKLTVLGISDCDAMREGYGTCSDLLHSVGESLNPKLPSPDDILAEIAKLRKWHEDLRSRQATIKAA